MYDIRVGNDYMTGQHCKLNPLFFLGYRNIE
jgi:hypothetical protein